MTEETEIIAKPGVASAKVENESGVGGVSIRAWLATVLVFTVCLNHLSVTLAVVIDAILHRDFSKIGTFTTVGEPLYSMAVAALGFYFGQKASKP